MQFETINALLNEFLACEDTDEKLGILDEIEEIAPHMLDDLNLLRTHLLKE